MARQIPNVGRIGRASKPSPAGCGRHGAGYQAIGEEDPFRWQGQNACSMPLSAAGKHAHLNNHGREALMMPRLDVRKISQIGTERIP